LRVLEAVARKHGVSLHFDHFDFSSWEYFERHGSMLPDAYGVILTDDRATVLFSLQGRTMFVGAQGQQLLRVLFETEAERYRWLNSALCVLEGQIEASLMRMRARVYVCVGELA